MIWLYAGENAISSRDEYLKRCEEYGPLNRRVLVADGLSLGRLEEELRSTPMLSGRYLIAIEGKLAGPVLKDLKRLISAVSESVDIAFWAGEALSPSYLQPFKGFAKIFISEEKVPKGIFPFLDALAGRNRKEALALLFKLTERGEEPMLILKMLSYEWRLLLRAKFGKESLSGVHPFAARNALLKAKNFSKEELAGAFSRILDGEVAYLSGEGDFEGMIEDFIFSVT